MMILFHILEEILIIIQKKRAQVWQELAYRLMPLQKRLRSWIGDFALIPSQSFYSRVHKFHIKIGTNVNGV